MMFGSISRSSARFQNDISTRSTLAPAVFSMIPFGTVFVPSISSSSAGSVGAIDVDDVLRRSASRAP